jgi:hypothetical protein
MAQSMKTQKQQRASNLTTRLVLQRRWYDTQRGTWEDWHDVPQRDLKHKYGETPEDWKRSCKAWIEMGGTYQFRIVERIDKFVWLIMCPANAEVRHGAKDADLD